MQSHSPPGAVLNPSQHMYNHSSHTLHYTMSSPTLGEQWNKLVSKVCLLLNLNVFDYSGKESKANFLQTLN